MARLELTKTEHGLFQTAVPKCNGSALVHVLDPSLRYVLIERHIPHPRIEWIEAVFPLSDASLLSPSSRRIRRLQADLLFETTEFLDSLKEFANSGFDLFQMAKMPTVASLSGLPERARVGVYENLGVEFRFLLPHANEVAVISSHRQTSIERIITRLSESGSL